MPLHRRKGAVWHVPENKIPLQSMTAAHDAEIGFNKGSNNLK